MIWNQPVGLQGSVRRMKPLRSRPRLCWSLLLLGVGSLLLLVVLQHLTDSVQQQNPGVPVLKAPLWPDRKVTSWQTEDIPAGLSPSFPPVLHLCSDPLLGKKQPVTKCHRKLLLKSAPFGGSPEQQSRRRQLNHVCSGYQPVHRRRQVRLQQVSQLYVEDRFRLLYCEVPKAGCSNWKRVLMVLAGRARSIQNISHDAAHYSNQLRRLDSYDWAGIAERLRTYTKVLFVREPFERLVAAFRDKFESPNSYYHPVFGRAIISRYRANATKSALNTGAGVTFREFVQYLLDAQRPVGMDTHWERVGQLCSPCLIPYDFIGKVESLQEDADFLLRGIGAPQNLTFPDFKDRNPQANRTSSRIMQDYFSQLNRTERQKVFEFYYRDYLMFSFPKPFPDLH
ncbi:carbohydrate sulfotransferase 8-like [Xiphophorus couchianus]|uniref:carbohydrate sulfotransferase 8-like n=1 Tax=Xiphophorus couchianus TaxID=32473 RepID=UPI001015D3EC|nr:carbohydrate sulfotransferase 8-like [Xiphophorus couchianus]XP_027881642.1 carbohydrate sulfotransferase 8-like [Xiphophorus couchianus]